MSAKRSPEPLGIEDARVVLREADLLCGEQEVTDAFDRMAAQITDSIGDSFPLVLSVMLGGLLPTARLLTRFEFPLQLDYIHATRYRGGTVGHELQWKAKPRESLEGRTVLIVDDILDEGVTLAGLLEFCQGQGARQVYSAVLVDKRHQRKSALQQADFTGLFVDDRYVFGCGMDYMGCFRNLSAIYAVKGL